MKTPVAAAVILVVTAGCTPGGTLGVLENARFSLDLPGHDTRTPIAEGATFSAGAFAEPCYEIFSSCPDIVGSLIVVSDTPSVIAPAPRGPGLECSRDVDCLAGSVCDEDGVPASSRTRAAAIRTPSCRAPSTRSRRWRTTRSSVSSWREFRRSCPTARSSPRRDAPARARARRRRSRFLRSRSCSLVVDGDNGTARSQPALMR